MLPGAPPPRQHRTSPGPTIAPVCGIVGIAGFEQPGLVAAMCRTITHRGPDHWGVLENPDASIGMQRLSILDLSPKGHQPMVSEDGKVAVVHNGEVYNFATIRDELTALGHAFTSGTDTEVLLRGYLQWGLDVLDRCNGMFATAFLDRRDSMTLHLVRDRLGIKPLYVFQDGRRLLFASEMKALLACKDVPRELNPTAVDHYLRFRYVPGEQCLLKGIEKLPAGHGLTWRDGTVKQWRWWTPPLVDTPTPMNETDAQAAFEEHLRASVARRMIADVPVGAYLSGGLDSSVLVALMAERTDHPVETFSVGFDSPYDELSEAQVVAKALGCSHHEIVCAPEHLALLPDIVHHLDEPIGDAIVLPMFLLARETAKHVKVVLSGEGADEILGGYLFHKVGAALLRYRRSVPAPARRVARWALGHTPHPWLNAAFSYPADLGEEGKHWVLELMDTAEGATTAELYRYLISLFSTGELDGLYAAPLRDALREAPRSISETPTGTHPLEQLLSLQYRDWLPDDILMKLDKMAMAHSLEGRVPFMDHTLVTWMLQTPTPLKVRGWQEKVLLRRFAAKLLPAEVHRRPKKPFYIPLERYRQTQAFKDLMDRTVAPPVVQARGFFQPEGVAALVRQSEGGDFLPLKKLLCLMMLELWCQRFLDA